MSARQHFEWMHRVVDNPELDDPALLVQLSEPQLDFIFPVREEDHVPFLGRVSRRGKETDFQYWWQKY